MFICFVCVYLHLRGVSLSLPGKMSFAKEKPKKKRADDEKPVIVKNTADLQRLKIEKLMKNPVSINVGLNHKF